MQILEPLSNWVISPDKFCHGSVDTLTTGLDTGFQTLRKNDEEKVKCVDTASSGVDTRPSSQRTQLTRSHARQEPRAFWEKGRRAGKWHLHPEEQSSAAKGRRRRRRIRRRKRREEARDCRSVDPEGDRAESVFGQSV
ncbi:hypothetical protein Taro_040104 [Colocasia esculenta]|uniref:Uncharacterized protein n=1 Tax=Colocasia esculenta TaxID=4460 RepID=A0A843WI75_COLES|nr:hypothetical protein [Colocasia esculenta]